MSITMSAQRNAIKPDARQASSLNEDCAASAGRRFLVIDDHPFFLEGLKLGLNSLDAFASRVDCYANALDALCDSARLRDYDLILCDLNLPGLDGITFIEKLIAADVYVRVAIISASEYALDVRRALNAGAAGYINKCASINEFARAINLILKGQRYTPEKQLMQPPANSRSAAQQADTSQVSPASVQAFQTLPSQIAQRLEQSGISPRQHEVLQLVAKGLSNQAISRELAIQESTVKSHLKVLFQILGVNNRTASIVAARSLNLLTDSD
jgi:DNA-binding NarL/FixJ family response regulator